MNPNQMSNLLVYNGWAYDALRPFYATNDRVNNTSSYQAYRQSAAFQRTESSPQPASFQQLPAFQRTESSQQPASFQQLPAFQRNEFNLPHTRYTALEPAMHALSALSATLIPSGVSNQASNPTVLFPGAGYTSYHITVSRYGHISSTTTLVPWDIASVALFENETTVVFTGPRIETLFAQKAAADQVMDFMLVPNIPYDVPSMGVYDGAAMGYEAHAPAPGSALQLAPAQAQAQLPQGYVSAAAQETAAQLLVQDIAGAQHWLASWDAEDPQYAASSLRVLVGRSEVKLLVVLDQMGEKNRGDMVVTSWGEIEVDEDSEVEDSVMGDDGESGDEEMGNVDVGVPEMGSAEVVDHQEGNLLWEQYPPKVDIVVWAWELQDEKSALDEDEVMDEETTVNVAIEEDPPAEDEVIEYVGGQKRGGAKI